MIVNDKIINKAKELSKGINSNLEKVKILTKFVQQMRYEEGYFGSHEIIPSTPEKTLEREYGDCKDKSILLISLINCLGMTAYPSILLTADVKRDTSSIPISEFNHMIVLYKDDEGKEYWIDPTAYCSRLGTLPWTDEGTKSIVFYNRSNIVKKFIPISNDSDNISNLRIHLNIDTNKSGTFDCLFKFKGEYNINLKDVLYHLDYDEFSKFLKSYLKEEFQNTEINDLEFSKLDDYNSDFEIHFKFHSNKILQKQGDLYILNFDPVKFSENVEWMKATTRLFPIYNLYKHQNKKEIEINFPDSMFIIEPLPQKFIADSSLYSYNKQFEVIGANKIDFFESLKIKSLIVPKGKFSEVKNFFSDIINKNSEKIIFKEIDNSQK